MATMLGTTYTFDVKGEEAEAAVTENGLYVSPEIVCCAEKLGDTLGTSEMYAYIGKNGRPYRTVTFTTAREYTEKTDGKPLIGLALLEMSDEGYIFSVVEFLPDTGSTARVSTARSFVIVTEDSDAYEFDPGIENIQFIRYQGANAYFLTRGDGCITISSLDAAEHELTKTENYTVTVESAE